MIEFLGVISVFRLIALYNIKTRAYAGINFDKEAV